MRMLHLLLLSAALSLGGCAAIDPHNILSRNARDANSDFQLNVLGEWGRTAAFDFVWDTINQNYVDPKFNGVDWTATAARYRPLAMRAKTDDDFWDVLNRMTGELRDSHTRVEPPNLVTLRRRQEAVSLGIDVDRVEGKISIVYVTPDSDAWWAGIRPGMEVTQIDGIPAEQRYAAVLAGWFQDIGRVKVVGQRSCGCLQGYLGYASVPGGAELAYSEIGMISVKGHRIEREGVVPDIEIPLTAEDLRINRDRSLEAAVEVLRKDQRLITTRR
jgi:C-terminal processing protease CtpA/Prc